MEKISWTECVRNVVLHRVKEEWNILHTIKIRKVNWIGYILHRNCLLKHVIEGKIEGTGRWGLIRKQLLDDVNETRGYYYETGSARSHSVENSLWRRLGTSRKTDYVVVVVVVVVVVAAAVVAVLVVVVVVVVAAAAAAAAAAAVLVVAAAAAANCESEMS
jgi:hypothetical protein